MGNYKKFFETCSMPTKLKEYMDDWCDNSSGHILDGITVDEEMEEVDNDLYKWLLENGACVDDEVIISNKG